MRVMVAALASEEPDTAPNNAEAASVATASPPRKPDRITRAALNSSPDSRDSDATSPMRMNSGNDRQRVGRRDVERRRAGERERALPAAARVTLPKKPTSNSAIQTGTRSISSDEQNDDAGNADQRRAHSECPSRSAVGRLAPRSATSAQKIVPARLRSATIHRM